MTRSRRTMTILFALMVIPLLAESGRKTYFGEQGGAVFVRVPSTRSKERVTRKNPLRIGEDCGEFGHACFGGYGKRGQMAVDDREQLGNVVPLDPTDYKTLQIFQQLCSLPPEQYSRMVPIFRRLVESYNTAAEEAITQK